MNRQGMVYIFTGDGKGKTSAAIATAVRAIGAGLSVAWVGFYKQPTWQSSEVEILKKIGIDIHLMGKGFFIHESTREIHTKAAQTALKKAAGLKCDVLILDEVCNAVSDGLIDLETLTAFISQRNQTHLILTGRNAPEKLIQLADLVTSMKKIKHPYDQGVLAIRGLDF